MMKKLECAAFLRENDHYVILTHRRPDGDTLGSAAALCRGLRQLGKTAFVLENPEITPKYTHLLEGLTTDHPENATVIAVDVASPGMLPVNCPEKEIALYEIPRLEQADTPVSASAVRAALQSGAFDTLRAMVPQTTFDYLEAHGFLNI